MHKSIKILMGENLIYDSSVKVGSHHYANIFSKNNDVFWLSLPWNVFLYLKYGKHGERYRQWNNGKPIYINDNFKVWSPLTFMPYRDNFIFKLKKNAYRMLKYSYPSLNKILAKYGFLKCDVLWITDPRMIQLTNIVKYKALVYRCVDNLEHFSGIPQNIVELEKELVEKSDVVFTTSEYLREKLLKYRNDICLLSNGVDFDFFSKKYNDKIDLLDNLNNKIIYCGTIGEWFDTELIKYCALKRPSYNFIIVGPVRTNINNLNGIKNVHIVGPIKYELVPKYLQHCDIGIIPFKNNELVDAVNPLKLYEYFACDLPTVVTKGKELERLNSPAKLCDTYDEFVNQMDYLISNKSIYLRENDLKSYAYENSWTNRFKVIKKVLLKKTGVDIH